MTSEEYYAHGCCREIPSLGCGVIQLAITLGVSAAPVIRTLFNIFHRQLLELHPSVTTRPPFLRANSLAPWSGTRTPRHPPILSRRRHQCCCVDAITLSILKPS